MTEQLRTAKAAAAKALQMLVYEASRGSNTFIDRGVAEAFIDNLAVVILETIAAKLEAEEQPHPEKDKDVSHHGLSA
jgi:hypothetical protein